MIQPGKLRVGSLRHAFLKNTMQTVSVCLKNRQLYDPIPNNVTRASISLHVISQLFVTLWRSALSMPVVQNQFYKPQIGVQVQNDLSHKTVQVWFSSKIKRSNLSTASRNDRKDQGPPNKLKCLSSTNIYVFQFMKWRPLSSRYYFFKSRYQFCRSARTLKFTVFSISEFYFIQPLISDTYESIPQNGIIGSQAL